MSALKGNNWLNTLISASTFIGKAIKSLRSQNINSADISSTERSEKLGAFRKQGTILTKNLSNADEAGEPDAVGENSEAAKSQEAEQEKPTEAQPEAAEPESDESPLEKAINALGVRVALGGATASSLLHGAAAVAGIFGFGSQTHKMLDKFALLSTKGVLSAICSIYAVPEFAAKRAWGFLCRIVEPFFFLKSSVEDMSLARGAALGVSQFVGAHSGRMAKIERRVKKMPFVEGFKTDFKENFKIAGSFIKELAVGGLGKNRRFLTGFTFDNIKTKLGEAMNEFSMSKVTSGLSKFFQGITADNFGPKAVEFLKDTGLDKIQEIFRGDPKKDAGHTVALTGHMLFWGGLLGYFFGVGKNMAVYRMAGLLRNLGGLMCDIAMWGDPDPEQNLAGCFLSVSSVLDPVIRFFPRSWERAINVCGNLSAAFYNVGVTIYQLSSFRKNQNKYVRHEDIDAAAATY